MSEVARKPTDGLIHLCTWALRYALRRKAGLAAVLAAMLLKVGLDALKPWPMKLLVDHVLNGRPMAPEFAAAVGRLPGAGEAQGLLAWCVAATVILFLLAWALGLAASFASLHFGQQMIYDLGADLYAHLQRLSLRSHTRRPVGDAVRRVTTDCGCVATIVKDALLPVLSSLAALALMFAVMWAIDSWLTMLSLLAAPGMILVFRRYAGPMMRRSYQQQEVEGRVYDVVEQTLSAAPVVQAFTREEEADRRFEASADATLTATLAATDVQLRFKVLMGLMTAMGTAGILWLGASHALDGRVSVGDILVFLLYLGSLYAPLEALMYTGSTLQAASGNARRVLEVMAEEPEVSDRPGAEALPPVAGHVRLEGVTFGYEPNRPVLRDVSLDVPPGQTVAVVGYTGAGKTTLVSLVPRFLDPWHGRVLIDERDVRDVRLRSLREQVAVVLQEPILFPLTVAENIAYGRPGAGREEIEAAARAANAHAFIERLPQGYDTVVGQRGATLSGGERQRLSIARALLKDAPILILDEPTSALDAETEGLLLEALRRLMKGRTTLLIAHRLSTVRGADRIVVLHEGRVAESGTHEELLARGGLYFQLHGRAIRFTGGGRPEGAMSQYPALEPGRWTDGALPANARVGANTVLTGDYAFKRFRSRRPEALVIGVNCTMDGVHFAVGEEGRIEIGDYCYFTNTVLLCELELRVGRYVVVGWNATIADTDFHPIAPAERIADAIACSPLGKGRQRPEIVRRPVVIEDDVWIGPNATILKGVRIGAGAFIEAGALVTRDVPARARVIGNPAQVIGEV